jgi:hypothetical protein
MGVNKLINGNFDVWQRGTTAVSSGYRADRWFASAGTESYSQGTATPPDGSFYYGIATRTTATSASLGLGQRIESAITRYLVGQTLTCSFYYRQTSGTITSCKLVVDYANALDNFTGTTNVYSLTSSITPSASWQKYTFTFVVTSNMATNGFQILVGAGTTVTGPVTINIAQVQLEVGSSATAFEQRQPGYELMLCQRYYIRHQSPGIGFRIGYGTYNSGSPGGQIVIPISMRATPTAIDTTGTPGDYSLGIGSASPVLTSVPSLATASSSSTSIYLNCITAVGASTDGFGAVIRAVNANMYIGISAEL